MGELESKAASHALRAEIIEENLDLVDKAVGGVNTLLSQGTVSRNFSLSLSRLLLLNALCDVILQEFHGELLQIVSAKKRSPETPSRPL